MVILILFYLRSVRFQFWNLNETLITGWQYACTEFTGKAVIICIWSSIRLFKIFYIIFINSKQQEETELAAKYLDQKTLSNLQQTFTWLKL